MGFAEKMSSTQRHIFLFTTGLLATSEYVRRSFVCSRSITTAKISTAKKNLRPSYGTTAPRTGSSERNREAGSLY